MDELAHSAGQDPLEFRRKLMSGHPKHLAVLNAVAERVDWEKPAPKGIYRGIAQHMGYGSYVAACAEVSVSDKGAVKIHRIVGRYRSGVCRQSGSSRTADRGLLCLRIVGIVLSGMHYQGRPYRTDQLRHLRVNAHQRNAEGRVHHHAVGRILGRCRGAHDLCGRARRAERDLRGHGAAFPIVPAEESRSSDRMTGENLAALASVVARSIHRSKKARPPGARSSSLEAC